MRATALDARRITEEEGVETAGKTISEFVPQLEYLLYEEHLGPNLASTNDVVIGQMNLIMHSHD